VSPAQASSGAAPVDGHLRVTQVRSGISTKPKHRGTLRALGLRGVGRSRVLPDVPDVRGMLARVPHLVTVESATADEAAGQQERSASARLARRTGQGVAGQQEIATSAPRARRATKEHA
jgi:large subunit ribosomal protein L30